MIKSDVTIGFIGKRRTRDEHVRFEREVLEETVREVLLRSPQFTREQLTDFVRWLVEDASVGWTRDERARFEREVVERAMRGGPEKRPLYTQTLIDWVRKLLIQINWRVRHEGIVYELRTVRRRGRIRRAPPSTELRGVNQDQLDVVRQLLNGTPEWRYRSAEGIVREVGRRRQATLHILRYLKSKGEYFGPEE